MNPAVLFSPPIDLEVWLLIGYATIVQAGAKVTEKLAQVHFARANRIAEKGFVYDSDADHYECPQGERLSLHVLDDDERIAVYRAAPTTCAGCSKKAACTPHDEGRHVFRPLAEWAETDVGRFHQWISMLMDLSVGVVTLAALFQWGDRPGAGYLLVVSVTAVAILLRDIRSRLSWFNQKSL